VSQELQPGYYRHRGTGRTVWVMGLARHTETGEVLVLHAPQGAPADTTAAEPLALFAGDDAPRWERVEKDRLARSVVGERG
jgi:hypothetical protein